MIISQIIKFKYSYKIYIDEEYIGVIRQKTLREFSFKENQEIDNIAMIKEIIAKDEYESGKNKILRLLGFSQKTKKEIIDKLKKDGFSEETIDKVLEFMEEYDFINDEKYASYYTESIKNLGKSRKAIKNALIKKGFDKQMISNSLNVISEDEEYINALKVGEKKLKSIKSDDLYEVSKKLKLYLSYKGFDYNVSDTVVRKLVKNNFEYE